MRRLLQFFWFNHRVVVRGKLSGELDVEGRRPDGFWF